MKRFIWEVMTPTPIRVEESTPIESARRMLETYSVRHLPVVREGKLIGVVSERELNVALAVARTNQLKVSVETAMQCPSFQVDRNVPIVDVIQRMIEEKFGCAVIMNRDEICGIFTTIDALSLLASFYRKQY